MSRLHRFIVNSATGYAFIAANFAYTLISVPLALHYLDTDEFGLWALALQITGYFMLLDLGVTSAISRFLADSKDDTRSFVYGRTFTAGVLVFIIQGALIAATGSVFALAAPSVFSVAPDLGPIFRNVLVILSCVSGLTVSLRGIASPLWAFQRLDVSYAMGIATVVLGFAVLWSGFALGWGVYSFAVAGIPGAVFCPALIFLICRRNGYYPPREMCWGFGWPLFRRIFLFGKDVLLMTLGSQLVGASQVMILSRVAGLEAAATFSIGTKLFTMGQQFAGRILESSAPSLTEIYVRGESILFRDRFRDVMALTVLFSMIFAAAIVCCNAGFISLWTSGTIKWSRNYDLLLGLLLVLTTATRCMVGIFGVVAILRPVRAVYFLEACVFIAIAIPAASHYGIAGLLLSSIAAHAAITAILPARAARRLLGHDTSFTRLMLTAITIVTVVFVAMQSIQRTTSLLELSFSSGLAVSATAIVGWYTLITPDMRAQLAVKTRSFLEGLRL